jgi:uncharacterized protein (TIGR00730 family)
MRIQRVCVYAASSPGAHAEYAQAASKLGALLAARGIAAVYGGGGVGLMGVLADAMRAAGGEILGIIPRSLVERESAGTAHAELRVVGSMHERKALMAEMADAFIALPGGFGTLEELVEMLTWAQLGMHDKPLGLVNVSGYYDRLCAFLDHAVREGFIAPAHRELLSVAPEPEAVLAALERRAAAQAA